MPRPTRGTDVAPEQQVPESEWKRVSVERSLQPARARAQARTDRFVAATLELMDERGTTDFTVQDVVDRSRMSIRTFYNFFASKDDLLLAVHETVVVHQVVPHLAGAIERHTDAGERLAAYIHAMFEMSQRPGPTWRALTIYHHRLAETRPTDLSRTFQPQLELVVGLVQALADAGRITSSMAPERAARLIHTAVIAAIHDRILNTSGGASFSAEELSDFCMQGLGVTARRRRR